MNLNIFASLLVLLSCMVACQKTLMNSNVVANRVSEQNNNEPASQVPAPSPTPKREVTLSSGWKLTPKSFKDVNHKLRYSIEGEYPQVNNSTDPRVLKLNREIKHKISKRYTYMTAPNPKEFSEHVRAFPEEDPLETAEFDYEIMLATDELLSIRFHETTYSRGAAHPLQGFFTVNYDAKSGKVMEVGDIFKSGYDYLQFLSQVSTEKLGVLEMWKDAVSPKRKNFQSWNIISEGIVINFDRCEVSACVDGTQTVIIPYSYFKEHLNPNHAVSRLATQAHNIGMHPTANSAALMRETCFISAVRRSG